MSHLDGLARPAWTGGQSAPVPLAGDMCEVMESVASRRRGQLATAEHRHDEMRNAVLEVMENAGVGHRGGDAALEVLHATFGEVKPEAEPGEFDRAVEWAGQLATVTADDSDPCEDFPPGWRPGRCRYTHLGRVLDSNDLNRIPEAKPLLEKWLDFPSAVMVIGATGTYKTFLLLAWAYAVATGTPWNGCAAPEGPQKVLYVVGEGGGGLKKRKKALEEAMGKNIPRGMLTFCVLPSSIAKPEFWIDVTELATSIGARMVILDTFSSLAPEADEVKDAAPLVSRMTRLSVRINGACACAHHTGWAEPKRARNASQFEANPDTIIITSRTVPADVDADAPREVWLKKTKEGPGNHKAYVVLKPAAESCVLDAVMAPAATGDEQEALTMVTGHPGKSVSALWPSGGLRKKRMADALARMEGDKVCRHPARPTGWAWFEAGSCPEPAYHGPTFSNPDDTRV